MRVVEVISGLGLGGAERALARRLEHAPADIDTHVLVTTQEDSYLSRRIAERATVHQDVTKLGYLIKSIRPDILVTHNPREALRVLSHAALPRRYPVVVVAHNEISSEYRLKAQLLDRLLPMVNSRARMHIAVSRRAAQGAQCANARSTRVCLLGGAFDPSSEPGYHYWPRGAAHRVLVLNRLSPQKNLFSLIEAVRLSQEILRDSGTHIVIAGDGLMRSELMAKVETLGIQDLVTFPGWIHDTDSVLAAADTLFVASRMEGGPLSLYEALLAGIRVISTPVGAAPDVLGSDPHLLLLPACDPGTLAFGLKAVSTSRPLLDSEKNTRRQRSAWLSADERAKAFYQLCREVKRD